MSDSIRPQEILDYLAYWLEDVAIEPDEASIRGFAESVIMEKTMYEVEYDDGEYKAVESPDYLEIQCTECGFYAVISGSKHTKLGDMVEYRCQNCSDLNGENTVTKFEVVGFLQRAQNKDSKTTEGGKQ